MAIELQNCDILQENYADLKAAYDRQQQAEEIPFYKRDYILYPIVIGLIYGGYELGRRNGI